MRLQQKIAMYILWGITILMAIVFVFDSLSFAENTNTELLEYYKKIKTPVFEMYVSSTIQQRSLTKMLHENTENFIPVVFAQCKMENLSVLTLTFYIEILRVLDNEASGVSMEILDHYITLLKRDLIKAKLFEGMAEYPDFSFKTVEQLLLEETVLKISQALDLLSDVKKTIEDFSIEKQNTEQKGN